MELLKINELNCIQNDYKCLIESYKNVFTTSKDLDELTVCTFIEEVEVFWLKRLDSTKILLEMLTHSKDCYLLSGAIYVGFKDKEHFPLKAIGDYQVVYDPFLKMEPFIRNNIYRMGSQSSFEFFLKVYNDTYKLLSECHTDFIILPIVHLAWNLEKEKHMEFLKDIHLKFLSGILGKEIKDLQDFCQYYNNYSEIKNDLDRFHLQNLIFSSREDEDLDLGERIENYLGKNLPQVMIKSEPEKFMLATFNMIGQITDILLTSKSLNLIPFIRYDVTFRYFLMMHSILKDDRETKIMLNKSIIAHIFYEIFPSTFYSHIDYKSFISQLGSYNLINDVYETLDIENTDLHEFKMSEIKRLINDKFRSNVLSKITT